MTKPNRPPTPEELLELWAIYIEKMKNWRKRKQEQNRQYYAKNKDKERLRKKRWQMEHKDHIRQYQNQPEVRAKTAERILRYIEKNPLCNLDKMEKFLRIAERTVPLEYSKDYGHRRIED